LRHIGVFGKRDFLFRHGSGAGGTTGFVAALHAHRATGRTIVDVNHGKISFDKLPLFLHFKGRTVNKNTSTFVANKKYNAIFRKLY